jgi:2-polyprenyl-3-methyl-5-hydroxy-6-metoxy-1,4-benzoquinol methylase
MGQEWFELAQTGESRMYFIMPYMLERLGDVHGKKILDLGCGEGGYSRELAKRGADVTAIDCSTYSIEYSIEQSEMNGLAYSISYVTVMIYMVLVIICLILSFVP